MSIPLFQVGDVVKWGSQSGGHFTWKFGTVARRVQPEEIPLRVFEREFNVPLCRRMFEGANPANFRFGIKRVQYIVALPLSSSRAKKHKVYLPNPKRLRLVEDPDRIEENFVCVPVLLKKGRQ